MQTSLFKAHSVMAASSTVASEKRVPLEDILHIADWNTDSILSRGSTINLSTRITMLRLSSKQDLVHCTLVLL